MYRGGDAVHRIPAAMPRERKERNDFVDRLLYVALRLVAAALHCFPVDTNLRTAKFIGSLLYRFDRRHRERAMGNLRRSFPEMTERRRARTAERSMQSLVMLGVEVLFTTRLIAKKGATTEVTEVLDQRGTVGFIADQNAGSKGLFVDFFGRKASTYKSIGLLAMEYEVPVVVGYARRLGDRFRFEVGVQDVI